LILSSREGAVAVLSLNRPEVRNALTPEMFLDLERGMDETLADGAVRALVITGEGRAFCGGFDLRRCLDDPRVLGVLLRALHGLVERLLNIDLPVVMAAHGAAIAGGCALLGGADVVVSDESARLGYPVTPLGISPAVSAPYLRQGLHDGGARARLLDPALVSGREAARIGLVHECVAGAELVRPRALAIAAELTGKGAIGPTKRWLRDLEGRRTPGTLRQRGLDASLGLIGSEEERRRLREALSRS
jgi:enoyl-CoA hydratase/carnithine racemase